MKGERSSTKVLIEGAEDSEETMLLNTRISCKITHGKPNLFVFGTYDYFVSLASKPRKIPCGVVKVAFVSLSF